MALSLINFKLIGFDSNQKIIHVGDDGRVCDHSIDGAEVIDCKGAYLSPGWCDLHVHIWHGGTDISVRASESGRGTGVTAMADAGSAGEANFHGLREYVIEPYTETIRAFLNIGSIGLVACNRIPELIDHRFINVDRTFKVIEANRDVICGIKVRASGMIVGHWGASPAKIAKRVAEICGLPLMVHVGEPAPLIDEIFDILDSGDIVTHCFNGKKGGSIRDTKKLFEQAIRLTDEGVRMDIGHGAASFDFEIARASIADGMLPFSISTDLHIHNIDGPVHDLATTMSKLLAVGVPMDECIAAVTTRPRTILGLGAEGGLKLGEKADFTIFNLSDASFKAIDSQENHLILEQMFEPRMTVIGSSAKSAQRRTK